MNTHQTTKSSGKMQSILSPIAGLRGILVGSVMAVSVVAASLTASAPAYTQQLCLLRDTAVSQLTKQHGEAVTGRGLATSGKHMVELYTAESGAWTLVTTDVNGQSCIIASGEAWLPVKSEPGEPA